MTLTIETPLSELALSSVEAGRVLHTHRLDYCCGGKRSLAEACRERGLDPGEILAEIGGGPAPAVSWLEQPLDAVIDHILAHYHAPLGPELERLVAMARKVERVHGEKPGCPRGLAEHLERVQEEVGLHLQKEEQILFPAIREAQAGFVPAPIQVMEREHEEHGRNLARTRELTDDLQPPAHACTTWRALYQGLETLERELMDHIALENNVLFPRALREL